MRQSKLDIIFKENDVKLKKYKLKSDPANMSKSYIGYILHEKPVKKSVTVEQSVAGKASDSILGGAGKVLKTIGGAVKGLEAAATKYEQIGKGDLSQLQTIGNFLLDKIFDKTTGKVMMLGKRGYKRVNLNDETLIQTLNEFVKNSVTKESFIIRVDETLRKANKSLISTPRTEKQLELKLGEEDGPGTLAWRRKMWLIFQNFTPEEKAKLGEMIKTLRAKKQSEQKIKEQTSSLDSYLSQVETDDDLLDVIQGEVEGETDTSKETFNENNLFFNIIKQRDFSTGIQFLLTPDDAEIKQKLNDAGISHVTLFKPKENNINSLDVYFYKDNENVIPQLMFSNLKYIYDSTKRAYVINSKIATKNAPTVFKQSLPVSVKSVELIYRDDANKQIKFNFKPEAFAQGSSLEKYKDKFVQQTNKPRLGKGELYASVGGPFMYSEGRDYYILDLSKMVVSFDRNAKFYPENEQQPKQNNT